MYCTNRGLPWLIQRQNLTHVLTCLVFTIQTRSCILILISKNDRKLFTVHCNWHVRFPKKDSLLIILVFIIIIILHFKTKVPVLLHVCLGACFVNCWAWSLLFKSLSENLGGRPL